MSSACVYALEEGLAGGGKGLEAGGVGFGPVAGFALSPAGGLGGAGGPLGGRLTFAPPVYPSIGLVGGVGMSKNEPT